MSQLRVVLVEDDPVARMDIREMLAEENIITVGECGDGLSGVNLVRALKPDLVLMDIKMPVMDGIEAARIMNEDKVAPVLLMTAYSQGEFIDEARKVGVLAYLVKPVSKQNLIPACKIAVQRYQEFYTLREEILSLQDALEARRVIEKAKGLLQKKYMLDEHAAFKKIRQIAMNQRKTMKEVAEAILMTLE